MSTSRRIAVVVAACLITTLGACTPAPLERVPIQRPPSQVPVQPSAQAPVPAPAPAPAVAPAAPQQQPAQRAPALPTRPVHQPPAAQQRPTAPQATDPLDSDVYRLASGDVVRIAVLGEAELSLDALIDPSGHISYPFLGRVRTSGLTVRELEHSIRSGLMSGYLVNPDVRVSLAQYRPIFVGGEVRQAGSYPYSLGLTAGQALTLAGGITTYGSEKRVYLQRSGSNGDRVRIELDTRVFPGDTLIVDERLF